MNKLNKKLSWQEVVSSLDLVPHVEGGFYRRTSEANHRNIVQTDYGDRLTMTTIYYLLTTESPIGHFHLNRSDINHFFHLGDPIVYYLIYPDGQLATHTMGNNISNGEIMQMYVPGGIWKASTIQPKNDHERYGYALIGEAVSPGFDFQDMSLGKQTSLIKQFPQHRTLIETLSQN